mgnify:CR=1 FL=1
MYNNNTYGFNPYMNQQRFQNQPLNQQPIQPQIGQIPQMTPSCSLLGKQVDSIDVVKATDIPLDGSTCYFPLIDGSAIVTKKLQTDGTSKTIIYKPIENDDDATIKYATLSDVENAIENIDLSDLDDIKDYIKDIKQSIKELKKRKKDY